MISVIPNIDFVLRVDGKFIKQNTDYFFSNKKIVMFALPGAFTPTCTSYHLPSYEEKYEEFKKFGIDEIYCLSMNDAFVMDVWKRDQKITKVKFLPDGNGRFTSGMNMISDRSASGMGPRSFRYSMYVDNKKIIKLFKDEDGKFDVSDSGTMLNFLASVNA
jgi:peroxiredoxin